MNEDKYFVIKGKIDERRLESRVLEEHIQDAVDKGHRRLRIEGYGQHGIGGRIWKQGAETVLVTIEGQSGQRVGSFGFPGTFIDVNGPASDDVGWLNAGAEIVVHGNAANGTSNGMAQGKVYVAGNIGARGMTMTKHNPRFEPPELWVLGSVGDYFGEFMAGGVAVICGYEPQNVENILGYRPFVGMVGGKVFFRGPHKGYSERDAKIVDISDDEWSWLQTNLKAFLERIKKPELLGNFTDRSGWTLLCARPPGDKVGAQYRSMNDFRREVWDAELGQGGLIGDLTDLDFSAIPVVTKGDMRRFVPVWENRKYVAPCESSCPTGIPVHERWRLIREGRVDEAVDLALAYTPFPAAVCGYLCPNLCMQGCTRGIMSMPPVDVTQLGKASLEAGLPKLPDLSGKKIAVIGGGPAGISVAWQLRLKGHEPVVHDMAEKLGGKITSLIPQSRIPENVIEKELGRAAKVIPHASLGKRLEKADMERLKREFDFIVIAAGAQKPRIIPIPGNERMISANDFLAKSRKDDIKPGKRIVIIGAGNVGCDVAAEAHRLGSENITLLDIQEPLSFGKEREHAEAAGAEFKWPVVSKEVTAEGVVLDTGETVPADTVVISIGDSPDLDFLPDSVATERGYVKVDEKFRTSDPKIFAIGDVVRTGLLTDAIGSGRRTAKAIDAAIKNEKANWETKQTINLGRVTLEYFDPRLTSFDDIHQCGSQCSSCGSCRDCEICINVCPQSAISRNDTGNGGYEYVVDGDKCIGCGFCANACPCGVWDLVENEPVG